jgi:hypothetical protein
VLSGVLGRRDMVYEHHLVWPLGPAGIRFELRQRQQERTPPSLPVPPIVEAYTASPEQGGPGRVEPAPLIALPMVPASDSRITEVVPEANEPIPQPRASVPRIPLEVEAPLMRWPKVRRISDTELAIKPSPFSKWLVLTSSALIDVRFFDEYPIAEEAPWLE